MPSQIVFPLFPQPDFASLGEDQLWLWRREQRELIRRNRDNPAVQALYNMLERTAARLQAAGIAPGAGPHEQGQAFGAGYLCGIVRGVFEGEEEDTPEEGI